MLKKENSHTSKSRSSLISILNLLVLVSHNGNDNNMFRYNERPIEFIDFRLIYFNMFLRKAIQQGKPRVLHDDQQQQRNANIERRDQ